MSRHQLSPEEIRLFDEKEHVGPFRCDAPESVPVRPLGRGSDTHLRHETVRRICSHPSITDRVAQVLRSEEVLLLKTRYWVKPANSLEATPWHQDVGRDNGGFLADGSPAPSVTAWLAIDRVMGANGCLRVIPGSRRKLFCKRTSTPLRMENGALQEDDIRDAVDCTAKRGEFYFFHFWILHSTGPNRTDHRRAALNMRFVSPQNAVEQQFVYLQVRGAGRQ